MRRHVLAFLILSLSLAVVISLASLVSLALPVAAALPAVWVDDDFDSGTPGWGTTHFDTIQAGGSAVDAGGTVHVAAGTYTVSLVINKSLTLAGEGRDVVTVNTADDNASVFRVTAGYVNISGFTIQGATGGGTIAVAGINLEGADYCTVSNNNATGNLVGIAMSTSNYVTVTNNIADSNLYIGIYLQDGCTNNNIEDNTCNSNEMHGIHLIDNCIHNTIQNNTATLNGNSGLCLGESCDNNTIAGNTFSNNSFDDGVTVNGHGISMKGSGDNFISGNTLNANLLYGMLVDEGSNSNVIQDNTANSNQVYDGFMVSGSSNGNLLDSNQADANGYAGIQLQNSNNCIVRNNQTNSNLSGGIYLLSSGGNTVTGNTANSNTKDGIWLDQGSNGNELTSDNASLNQEAGILISDSNDNTVGNNTAESNSIYGIYLFQSGNNTLDGNTAGSAFFGIALEYSDNNTLNGNSALANEYDGMSILLSNNNTIVSNTVSSNNWTGISLAGSNGNILGDNDVDSNGDEGIFIETSDNNTLTGNICSNNETGIVLWAADGGEPCNNHTLEDNIVTNNGWGISLHFARNATLTGNVMAGNDWNFGVGVGPNPWSDFGGDLSLYVHNIDTSNTVDGKPVYYWVGEHDKQIPADAGYVGVIDSDNITVKDLTLTKACQGVLLAYTRDSTIENVNASNSLYGICIWNDSTNNLITGNNAGSNDASGIFVYNADVNTIVGNTADSNWTAGISLARSHNNQIEGNITSGNGGINIGYSGYGISLKGSSNNMVVDNTANSNLIGGIAVLLYGVNDSSYNNVIHGNSVSDSTWNLGDGIEVSDSSGNVVDGNNVSLNHGNGILVAYSTGSSVTANVINSNNGDGISVWRASNNVFTNNVASGNGVYDFHSDQYSHNNIITSLAIGGSFPTTISFTYDNGVGIKGVEAVPASPTGKGDINKYIEVTGLTAGFWLSLKVHYAESDLNSMDESTLSMWRYDGNTWAQVSAPNSVSAAENYVSAYIQSSGVFAPLADAGPAPMAFDDSYIVDEDTALTVPASGVLVNDTDADSTTLTAVLVSGPSHGTLTLNTDGSFSYTPAADYNGTDSFTYRANDGQSNSNVAAVTITINPVNDPPTAVDDSYIVDKDTALTVPASGVLGNDTDADSTTLTTVLVSGPSHGTLTLNPDGSFSYTPAADYSGTDSFTYKANDGQVDSGPATVTIDVIPSENTPSGGGWVRAVVPWLAAAVALFVLILVLVARRRRKKKPHPE